MSGIFVISAPSGTGKTTIAQNLKKHRNDIFIPVTYTTKKPRPEEVNGRDYHFVSRLVFNNLIEKGKLIEWAQVYGNYYGTPKDEVFKNLDKGKKVVLTIDTQGGLNVKKLFPKAVLIGILPPSLAEQEKRIRKRSRLSEEAIKTRIESARKERKALFAYYDYRFVNKKLDSTVSKILGVIDKG